MATLDDLCIQVLHQLCTEIFGDSDDDDTEPDESFALDLNFVPESDDDGDSDDEPFTLIFDDIPIDHDPNVISGTNN